MMECNYLIRVLFKNHGSLRTVNGIISEGCGCMEACNIAEKPILNTMYSWCAPDFTRMVKQTTREVLSSSRQFVCLIFGTRRTYLELEVRLLVLGVVFWKLEAEAMVS